jgi:hypothetical protein
MRVKTGVISDTERRKFRRMAEKDPRAKHRVLPLPVDSDYIVAEVDTDVEHAGSPITTTARPLTCALPDGYSTRC